MPGRLKTLLKRHIHLPYIMWRQRMAGRRYSKAPLRRAVELFHADYGRDISWADPQEFAEKIRYLQFRTDISAWPVLADKLAARQVVTEKGLAHMLVPLLGSWTSPKEIDFSSLGASYVIKPNNGCGDIHIVPDSAKAHTRAIRRALTRALSHTYGDFYAETHYRAIPPAIIAELLLTDPAHPEGVPDYKFYCADGRPIMCMVCSHRGFAGPGTKRVAVYDMDWNPHPEWLRPEVAANSLPMARPASLQSMIQACHILAADLPFVRLDLYEAAGRPYFGEFTLTPAALQRRVSLSDEALRHIARHITLPRHSSRPRLTVAISTFGADGIGRVAGMGLPPVDNVEYVVSWQRAGDAAVPREIASRPDIRVVPASTLGLSNNRNHSIAAARGEIILLADDDLSYTPAGLQTVINTFDSDPSIDFATFRYDKPRFKRYPAKITPYSRLPKGFAPASIEIAFRNYMAHAPAAPAFNPLLGIGAPYLQCGEENLFIMQAQARGYKGTFFPVTITTHRGEPTGARKVERPGVLRAQGALIALRRPCLWPAAIFPNAWRTSRRGRATLLKSLLWMTQGAIYAIRNRKLLS